MGSRLSSKHLLLQSRKNRRVRNTEGKRQSTKDNKKKRSKNIRGKNKTVKKTEIKRKKDNVNEERNK
jgi:hypothetical protein